MTDATCSCSISAQYPRYYDTGVIGPAFVTLVSGLTEGQQFSVQLQQIHQVIANAATSALGINAAQSYAQPPLVNMAFPRLIDALFSNGKSQFFRCVKTNAEFRRSVFKLYAARDIFEFLADVVARDGAVNDPSQPEIRELAKIATAAAAIQHGGNSKQTMQALEEMRDDIANALKRMRGETQSAVEETLSSGGWFSKLMEVGKQVSHHAEQIAHVANKVSQVAGTVNALNQRYLHADGGYGGMIGADGPGMIGADGPGMIGADGPGMIGAEGNCESDEVNAGGLAYTTNGWIETVGGSPNGFDGVTIHGTPFVNKLQYAKACEMIGINDKPLKDVIGITSVPPTFMSVEMLDGIKKLIDDLNAALSNASMTAKKNEWTPVIQQITKLYSELKSEAAKGFGHTAVEEGYERKSYMYTRRPALSATWDNVIKQISNPARMMLKETQAKPVRPAMRRFYSPVKDYVMLFSNGKLVTGAEWSSIKKLHKYGAGKTPSGAPSRRSINGILSRIADRTVAETAVMYYTTLITMFGTWYTVGHNLPMIEKQRIKKMIGDPWASFITDERIPEDTRYKTLRKVGQGEALFNTSRFAHRFLGAHRGTGLFGDEEEEDVTDGDDFGVPEEVNEEAPPPAPAQLTPEQQREVSAITTRLHEIQSQTQPGMSGPINIGGRQGAFARGVNVRPKRQLTN
jgi:hypothetical protein